MTRLLRAFARLIVGWAPRLFGLSVIVLLASFPLLGPRLWPVQINNTLDTLLEQHTPQAAVDRNIQKDFGSLDEIIILVYRDEDLFTEPNLKLVATLTKAIERVDGVKNCFSLANTPFFRNRLEDGESILEVAPLLDEIPTSAEGLEQHRLDAVGNTLYRNNIISRDGKTAAFNIILNDHLAPLEKERVVRDIRQLYGGLAPVPPGQFFFTGMHVFMETTGVQMQRDVMQFSVVSVILLLGALFAVFRSWWLALTALLTAGVANWLLFVGLHFLGRTLSISTTPVPAITTGLAIAYVLHFLTAKREGILGDPAEAEHIVFGNLLSVLTTMIGFLSLCLNPIPTLQDFGLFAGMGTFFAFLAVTLYGFPLLQRLPHQPRKEFGAGAKAVLETFFFQHRRLVVGISVVIFLSGAFLFRMEVQTDYYKYYLRDAPMTKAVDFVNTHIGGQYPIVVDLDTGETEGVYHEKTLHFLEEFKAHCVKFQGVDKIITYLDLLNDGHRGFAGEPEDGWYASRAKVGQIAMVVYDANNDLTSYYVDGEARRTLIFVRTSHINSASFLNIDRGIREFLAKNAPKGITYQVGGTYLRCVQSANRMALSQLYGTFAAIAVLFLVAFAAIPRPRLIFLAFIVNFLPILGIYGLLGLLGETLNMGTTTIAAISIGIGMDDTMHFLARFISGLDAGKTPVESARYVIHSSGVAMILTSAMIALTFLSLSLSIIKPICQLGMFTSVTMALCLLADLFLLPVLATWGASMKDPEPKESMSG